MAKKTVTEIRIDHGRCKGCDICVAFCTRDVLALNEFQKAVVVDLPACTGCDLCVLRCPDFAVELVYANIEEEGSDNG
ncbi:MAG: 4Fe-4S dicluster domain-containing protein [Pseudomonadota bacterium]